MHPKSKFINHGCATTQISQIRCQIWSLFTEVVSFKRNFMSLALASLSYCQAALLRPPLQQQQQLRPPKPTPVVNNVVRVPNTILVQQPNAVHHTPASVVTNGAVNNGNAVQHTHPTTAGMGSPVVLSNQPSTSKTNPALHAKVTNAKDRPKDKQSFAYKWVFRVSQLLKLSLILLLILHFHSW